MIVSVLGAAISPTMCSGDRPDERMMIIPNIIALFWLYRKAKVVFADYETQLESGRKRPLYNGIIPHRKPKWNLSEWKRITKLRMHAAWQLAAADCGRCKFRILNPGNFFDSSGRRAGRKIRIPRVPVSFFEAAAEQ